MYQFAMKTALMLQFPNQTFKDDITHYKLFDEHNGFELDRYFDIEFDFAFKTEIKRVYNGYIPGRLVGFLPLKIRKKILYKYQHYYRRIKNMICPCKRKKIIEEADIQSRNIKDLSEGDWYVSGMWQNLKWFDMYRDVILRTFRWKVQLDESEDNVCKYLESGAAIAVHVRGGDYINNSQNRYELCKQEYYDKALKCFEDKNPKIYVFTDDIEYAMSILNNIKNVRVAGFVSHDVSESVKDMYMLSKSKKLILANSTFSFWSGYLDEIKGAKIIAPQYAYYNGTKYVDFNYRENWEIIKNV